MKLRFASRERRQFHRVCKATRARGSLDRCGGLRRLSFEMCGARGHAYVMITPQQCLAGLFFLAAALALVGFFGLFFAMAHVRLVIPLAIIAKMLRARVTALPNSRAALSFISFQLPSKTGFVASKIVSKTARSRLFDTARQGSSPHRVPQQHRQGFATAASLWQLQPPCLHSCNFTQHTCDVTQLQRR